jgi:hypothetical protein
MAKARGAKNAKDNTQKKNTLPILKRIEKDATDG